MYQILVHPQIPAAWTALESMTCAHYSIIWDIKPKLPGLSIKEWICSSKYSRRFIRDVDHFSRMLRKAEQIPALTKNKNKTKQKQRELVCLRAIAISPWNKLITVIIVLITMTRTDYLSGSAQAQSYGHKKAWAAVPMFIHKRLLLLLLLFYFFFLKLTMQSRPQNWKRKCCCIFSSGLREPTRKNVSPGFLQDLIQFSAGVRFSNVPKLFGEWVPYSKSGD